MELRWQVNEKKGTFDLKTEKNVVIVPVTRGEAFTRVWAELRVAPAEKMFFNGFQTWTHCPEYTSGHKIRALHGLPRIAGNWLALNHFADYHFVDYPAQVGILHGVSWCYFRTGMFYRLFASLDETPGYTLFRYHVHSNTLVIERDCQGVAADDSVFHAFDLFYAEGSETEVFDQWFDALGIRNAPPPIKGYSSWYNHYQRINEQRIQADLEGAVKLFDPGDLFQIDDGWESAVGDWEMVDQKKFPNGLDSAAGKIHDAGFRAGLWLAPFICERKSAVFRHHPDWFLQYNGRPWKDGPNWSGSYSLDIDHHEVKDYLARVFHQVLDEWGFDLVKLDFLYGAAPFATGDHGNSGDGPFTESRAARMTRAMKFLRELCGERLIIGCGVPVMPAFGQVDYCRVGPDVSLDWDDKPFMRIIHRERVSTRQSIDNTIYRRELDGRAYGIDPDVFFLREKNLSLKESEKIYLATLDALFGSVWLTSDQLNAYDPAKTDLYHRLAGLRDAENKSIDPDTLTIRYTLDGKEYTLPYPRTNHN